MARDYGSEILGAEQQRKTAQALREQAMRAPEGQMISGWYVAPHATQYAAQALGQYLAGKKEKEASQAQQEAQTAKAAELAALLKGYGTKEVQPVNTAAMNQAVSGSVVDNAVQGYQPAQQVPLNQNEQLAQDIRLQQLDPLAAQMLEKRQSREDTQAARMQEMQARIAAQQAQSQESNQLRRDLAEQNRQTQLQVAQQQAQSPKMNPTIEKEIFEADDKVMAGQNVLGALQQASEINKLPTYSGYGAQARAIARSNLPGQSDEASNTIQLTNIMQGQALESLKATFGGSPTEGERQILLDLQASADKSPADRQKIIDRAIAAAQQRMRFNQSKAEGLRQGTYFRAGQTPVPAQQAAPKVLRFDAQGNPI